MSTEMNIRSTKSTSSSIRVIYIMGYGRSGSTVLDTVLGNHRDIQSVGELINAPRSAWINNEYCACVRRSDECPFWLQVKRVWTDLTGITDVYEYVAMEEALQRRRLIFQGFLKPDFTSTKYLSYAKNTLALFEAIQIVSGKSIIVDSSKIPLRAFALSCIQGIDLRLIHLVRDGRGVAWSLKRSFIKNERKGVQVDLKPHPVWRSAIAWLYTNLQSGWVRHQIDEKQSIQVRYEDLINKPRNTLLKIGQLVDVDFNIIVHALEAGESMNVSHIVAGNRLRMDGKIKLQLDEEWKKRLSQTEKRQFQAIAGYLIKRYRYYES